MIRFTAHDPIELCPVDQQHHIQPNSEMIICGTVKGYYSERNELRIFLDPNITRAYEQQLQPGLRFGNPLESGSRPKIFYFLN